MDGSDEVGGRFADQTDRAGFRLVEDPGGDAFGAGVNLRPGPPGPCVGLLVEDHQVVS